MALCECTGADDDKSPKCIICRLSFSHTIKDTVQACVAATRDLFESLDGLSASDSEEELEDYDGDETIVRRQQLVSEIQRFNRVIDINLQTFRFKVAAHFGRQDFVSLLGEGSPDDAANDPKRWNTL